MKKRFTAMAALAVLLVFALAGAALAEETPDTPDATLETEVSIGFEGAVYFVDMGAAGMDIDFGSHMIPPRGSAVYFPASDSSHTLRVCDRRANPGKWEVHASMGPFESENESFPGFLNFFHPIITPGLTPRIVGTGADERIDVIPNQMRIIVTATEDLSPGEYDMTATAENTRMYINNSQLVHVKPDAYTGTATWTLTLTP